jgi:hypothetical protein
VQLMDQQANPGGSLNGSIGYAEKIAGFDRVLVINVTQENVEETHMNHGPQSRTSAEHRETERKQNMGTLDKTGEKHENN